VDDVKSISSVFLSRDITLMRDIDVPVLDETA